MHAETHTLLILDGDLPSLVAVALAAEARLVSPHESSVTSRVRGGASVAVTLAWCAGSELEVGAAVRHATHFDFRVVARSVDPEGTARDRQEERSEGLRLIAAVTAAARLGCRRVVWPVQTETGGRVEQVRVEQAARLIDLATLAGRLVSIDFGVEISVETPFVDLSDRQIADLAIDMALDRTLCWWGERMEGESGGGGGASIAHMAANARRRWEAAYTLAGWTPEVYSPLGTARIASQQGPGGPGSSPGIASGEDRTP